MAQNRAENTVLGTVVLGIVTSGAYSFLSEKAAAWTMLVSIALTGAIAAWFGIKLVAELKTRLRRGQYSILVFLLDSRKRILLIKHPFHGVYLPPGGRLAPCEPPDQGVARVLREEAGLEHFRFHPVFHEPSAQMSERVEQVPRPLAMQMEHREQRTWVPFHYAMVYVCLPSNEPFVPPLLAPYHPKWFDLEEIRALPHGEYPFDDIVVRYETLLAELNKKARPAARTRRTA